MRSVGSRQREPGINYQLYREMGGVVNVRPGGRYSRTKEEMEEEIVRKLGGKAATELVLGKTDVAMTCQERFLWLTILWMIAVPAGLIRLPAK